MPICLFLRVDAYSAWCAMPRLCHDAAPMFSASMIARHAAQMQYAICAKSRRDIGSLLPAFSILLICAWYRWCRASSGDAFDMLFTRLLMLPPARSSLCPRAMARYASPARHMAIFCVHFLMSPMMPIWYAPPAWYYACCRTPVAALMFSRFIRRADDIFDGTYDYAHTRCEPLCASAVTAIFIMRFHVYYLPRRLMLDWCLILPLFHAHVSWRHTISPYTALRYFTLFAARCCSLVSIFHTPRCRCHFIDADAFCHARCFVWYLCCCHTFAAAQPPHILLIYATIFSLLMLRWFHTFAMLAPPPSIFFFRRYALLIMLYAFAIFFCCWCRLLLAHFRRPCLSMIYADAPAAAAATRCLAMLMLPLFRYAIRRLLMPADVISITSALMLFMLRYDATLLFDASPYATYALSGVVAARYVPRYGVPYAILCLSSLAWCALLILMLPTRIRLPCHCFMSPLFARHADMLSRAMLSIWRLFIPSMRHVKMSIRHADFMPRVYYARAYCFFPRDSRCRRLICYAFVAMRFTYWCCRDVLPIFCHIRCPLMPLFDKIFMSALMLYLLRLMRAFFTRDIDAFIFAYIWSFRHYMRRWFFTPPPFIRYLHIRWCLLRAMLATYLFFIYAIERTPFCFIYLLLW